MMYYMYVLKVLSVGVRTIFNVLPQTRDRRWNETKRNITLVLALETKLKVWPTWFLSPKPKKVTDFCFFFEMELNYIQIRFVLKTKTKYSKNSFIARLVHNKARDLSIAWLERSLNPHLSHICNTVVKTKINPLFALKTNLTDSYGSESLFRLALNESRSFQSVAINESWL